MSVMWFNDMTGGINQNAAPNLIGDNQFEITVNASRMMTGALSSRLGNTKFLDSVASSGSVRGLDTYYKPDGSTYVHMVHNGNIYKATGGDSSWTSQISSAFGATSDVNFANFLGRHYMASSTSSEYLSYITDSSSSKNVVSGNVEGKYIAANGAYLLVAGGTTNPTTSYFSTPSSDTFNTTRDIFSTVLPPTGVASLGNGRPFIIFTQQSYTIADPSQLYSSQVDGFGCTSHRSIANVWGNLIWLSWDGFYLLSNTSSYPTNISNTIRNTQTGDAIFNQIAAGNFSLAAAGTRNSRYYCALRDLNTTVRGQTLNSAVLEFDILQGTWAIHTCSTNKLAAVFTSYFDSSLGYMLLAGSYADGTVYRMETPNTYTDDDKDGTATPYNCIIRTKQKELSDKEGPVYTNNVLRTYLKYYGASAVSVKYAFDGGSYTSTPSSYPIYTTTAWNVQNMYLNKATASSVGLEFTTSGKFYMYGYGLDVTGRRSPGTKGV